MIRWLYGLRFRQDNLCKSLIYKGFLVFGWSGIHPTLRVDFTNSTSSAFYDCLEGFMTPKQQ
jgi:hypothetical protein